MIGTHPADRAAALMDEWEINGSLESQAAHFVDRLSFPPSPDSTITSARQELAGLDRYIEIAEGVSVVANALYRLLAIIPRDERTAANIFVIEKSDKSVTAKYLKARSDARTVGVFYPMLYAGTVYPQPRLHEFLPSGHRPLRAIMLTVVPKFPAETMLTLITTGPAGSTLVSNYYRATCFFTEGRFRVHTARNTLLQEGPLRSHLGRHQADEAWSTEWDTESWDIEGLKKGGPTDRLIDLLPELAEYLTTVADHLSVIDTD